MFRAAVLPYPQNIGDAARWRHREDRRFRAPRNTRQRRRRINDRGRLPRLTDSFLPSLARPNRARRAPTNARRDPCCAADARETAVRLPRLRG